MIFYDGDAAIGNWYPLVIVFPNEVKKDLGERKLSHFFKIT